MDCELIAVGLVGLVMYCQWIDHWIANGYLYHHKWVVNVSNEGQLEAQGMNAENQEMRKCPKMTKRYQMVKVVKPQWGSAELGHPRNPWNRQKMVPRSGPFWVPLWVPKVPPSEPADGPLGLL